MTDVDNIKILDVGVLCVQCSFCKGLSFMSEVGRSRNSCCHSGKIKLCKISKFPSVLQDLLYGKMNSQAIFVKMCEAITTHSLSHHLTARQSTFMEEVLIV
ncbi:hypothetical protein B4U80_09739 [Leptotrombidium deliense]|uniref:Uncharacterized protein n=1 Tax=Leptotrombidium deliense TaxID=299467 RepID=A0A443RU50_9ACAR|nr:hypothetical protein B4U80_09739 [Leptotrombidium deliense]